jgi:hypothetical protein
MDRRSFLLGLGATAAVAGTERALFVHDLSLDAETFDFGLRCNDLGTTLGEFTPSSALDDSERRVVEAAVAGAYETERPPAWLRRFVHGTDYVRVDGQFYELSSTLPTYVVEPTVVDPASVDGLVASRERYRQLREREYGVSCALTCETADGGYRTTRTVWLRPETAAFLEQFDYVEHHGSVVELDFHVDDPGPPYQVTARRVAAADVRGGATVDVDDFPADSSADLRRATRSPGVTGVDDIPPAVVDALRSHTYLRVDGRYYTTYLSDVRDAPLAAWGRVSHSETAPLEPARLELGVRNTGDISVEVSGGPPMPFGVLSAYPPGEPNRDRPLWSPAYRETGAITTLFRRPIAVLGIGQTATVAPGETLTTAYAFGPLRPGTWLVDEDVGVTVDGETYGSVPLRFTLRFG